MNNNDNLVTIEDEAMQIIDKAYAVIGEIGGPQKLMEYFYPSLKNGYCYDKQISEESCQRGYNPSTGRLLALDKVVTLISIGQKKGAQEVVEAGVQLIGEYNSTCVGIVAGALERGVISKDILRKSSGEFLEAWKNHDGTIENQINSSFAPTLCATVDQLGLKAIPEEQVQE